MLVLAVFMLIKRWLPVFHSPELTVVPVGSLLVLVHSAE